MSVQTTDTTFFCKNPALLRLTTQLYLPLLLFTLSSREYFTFTEDSNTRLSGSIQGANPGLKVQTPGSQLLDWYTHEHPGSCQSLCFCFVSRNQFLLLGSFWLQIKKLNLNHHRQKSRHLLPWQWKVAKNWDKIGPQGELEVGHFV